MINDPLQAFGSLFVEDKVCPYFWQFFNFAAVYESHF